MNDPTAEDELEETERINVVPLADLTLVLLIILMVLSPMISQSMIHVAAPAVANGGKTPAGAAAPPAPLLISISPTGYTLNNESAPSLEVLMAAMVIRLSENPKRPVIITAEEGVRVGRVVEVLDSAKRHGAGQISLVRSTKVGS